MLIRAARAAIRWCGGGVIYPDTVIRELGDVLAQDDSQLVHVSRTQLSRLLNWAQQQSDVAPQVDAMIAEIDVSLIVVLVNAIHDRCFGIASLLNPERALEEISDGGGIHEVAHALLRLLPSRHIERVRSAPSPRSDA